MDFGRALSFVRQDPGWVGKVILGSLISLVPILNFAAYGYMLDVIRNVYEGRETPLPEWGSDFGGYFVRGLIYLVILLIYLLPVIVIYGLFVAIVGGTAASIDASGSEAAGAGLGIAALCFIPIIFISAIVLGLLAQIAGVRYGLTQDFSAAMRFGEVWNTFRSNIGTWLMLILFLIVLQLVFGVFTLVTCGIGAILFSLYAVLAQGHLTAQAYRQSAGSGVITEPARY
jgi:hypothetical protein